MAEEFPQMPCGCCDAGTYSATPVLNGLAMFGSCETRKDALRAAPRCKHNGKRICFGARDWIISMTFPITAGRRQEILDAIYR